MEFYLVDDLECDLVIFHPYRTLMSLVTEYRSVTDAEREAGELGIGVNDPKYWGAGEEKLVLQIGGTQMAWYDWHASTLRAHDC
jgi:cyclin C